MIDIVVPVYNEGGNIKALFEQIKDEIKTEKRVLIVYDFDEDNTVPVVSTIKNDYNYEIVLHKNTIGRGALNAIKTGFHHTSAKKVLVAMADLSDSLSIVDNMSTLMDEGYDVVCASRYMKGGKQIGGPLLKKTFSRMAGVSLHYLIGIPTHDISNSFRLYSKKVLDMFDIESTGGFELAMELTVKAYVNGLRVTEVPSVWLDRVDGESNFKMWSWLPKYLHWYFYAIMYKWFGVGKKKHSQRNDK